ncbi:S41 family peptidase [Streptomyces collinus]|uniref:S41 family peptidase n=1 Tax=Streptomyces collinus TaxID=42684 RepID=UPI0036BC136B
MVLAVVAGPVAAGPVAAAGPAVGAPGASTAAAGVDGMAGVWRSDGYGTVLALEDGRLREYQTTAVSCLPGDSAQFTGRGADGTVLYTGADETVYRIRAQGRGRARLHVDGSVGDRRLRRLPALPGRCTQAQPAGARAAFDVFWQTFEENYPFFAAKHHDWHAVRDRYRAKVHDGMPDGELFALLRAMVRPLHDAHVFLDAGDTGFFAQGRPGTAIPSPELDQQARNYVEQQDLTGTALQSFAGGRIGYARLADGTGYLRISGFGGYDGVSRAYARDSAVLDGALSEVITPRLKHLILDLRINGGGSDALALQVAERLTDHPYLAYAKRTRNNPRDPAGFTRPQPIRVTPAPGRERYNGPLAVLTGGETYSAGETLTQALMGRPAFTVRVGQNTQGVFSDILTRTLPSGWTFGLPDEEYLTPCGTTFDGPGIPPDIRTGDFVHDIGQGTPDSAFAQALAALRAHDARPPVPDGPDRKGQGPGRPCPGPTDMGCCGSRSGSSWERARPWDWPPS